MGLVHVQPHLPAVCGLGELLPQKYIVHSSPHSTLSAANHLKGLTSYLLSCHK